MNKELSTEKINNTETRVETLINEMSLWASLKDVKREIIRGKDFEDDLTHTFLMERLLYNLLPELEKEYSCVDWYLVAKMIAVHDLPEVISGDTWYLAKSDEDRGKEHMAAQTVLNPYPHLMEVYNKYSAKDSDEWFITKSLDILQAVLSLLENKGRNWRMNKVTFKMESLFGLWIIKKNPTGIISRMLASAYLIGFHKDYFYPSEQDCESQEIFEYLQSIINQ